MNGNGLKGNFYQTLWWRWKDEKHVRTHSALSQKLKLQNWYWNWNVFIVFTPHNEYISYLLSSYILHFFIHFFIHTSFHTYFFLTWRLVYLWIYLFSNIIKQFNKSDYTYSCQSFLNQQRSNRATATDKAPLGMLKININANVG